MALKAHCAVDFFSYNTYSESTEQFLSSDKKSHAGQRLLKKLKKTFR